MVPLKSNAQASYTAERLSQIRTSVASIADMKQEEEHALR